MVIISDRGGIAVYMYNHFKNIEKLYGKAYIQMPCDIFSKLASIDSNIQQISFCFSYLASICFLYKYSHFVDIDNMTYIQNSDIKEVLGYNRKTKSIDKFIKKNGILESMMLIKTTKNYPVGVRYIDERINGIKIREFVTIDQIGNNSPNYCLIKKIVKNKNYEIKEPVFLFEHNGDVGTLYNYENTFRIYLNEFMNFIYDENLDNIDFMLYSFFKYKCFGLKDNAKQISLWKITSETGIGKDSFYIHLENLKNKKFIEVIHKDWEILESKDSEANEYCFKGISLVKR